MEIIGIMIRENRLIKGININDEEHKSAQFADDTQMMSEGDAISFEKSISTVDNFTKYLPHIKIDWNPPRFKILGEWLTADLTDCEEINYNNKFSEMKILFNSRIKRTTTPLGKSHSEISDSIEICTVMDATAKSTWWCYW